MKSSLLIPLSLFSFSLIAQSSEFELRASNLYRCEKDSHLHVQMILTDQTGEEEVISSASLTISNFGFNGEAGFEPAFFYFEPREIITVSDPSGEDRIFCFNTKYQNPEDSGYRGFVGALYFRIPEERAEECYTLMTKAGYENWKITEALKID